MFGIFTRKPLIQTLGLTAAVMDRPEPRARTVAEPALPPPRGTEETKQPLADLAAVAAQSFRRAFDRSLVMDKSLDRLAGLGAARQAKQASNSDLAFAASHELKLLVAGVKALEGTELHSIYAPKVAALQKEWVRRAAASLDWARAKVATASLRVVDRDGNTVKADNYHRAIFGLVAPIAQSKYGSAAGEAALRLAEDARWVSDHTGMESFDMIVRARSALERIASLRSYKGGLHATGDAILDSLERDLNRLLEFHADFAEAFPAVAAKRTGRLAERESEQFMPLLVHSAQGSFEEGVEAMKRFYPDGDPSHPPKMVNADNAYAIENEMGLDLHGSGEPRRAIPPFLRNLERSEAAKDQFGLRATAMQLAQVYLDLGQFNEAEAMAERGMRASEAIRRAVFKDEPFVAATQQFQQRVGLPTTGQVDAQTLGAAAWAGQTEPKDSATAIYAHGLVGRMARASDAVEWQCKAGALMGHVQRLLGREKEAAASFRSVAALSGRQLGGAYGTMQAEFLIAHGEVTRPLAAASNAKKQALEAPVPQPHEAARACLVMARAIHHSDAEGALGHLDEAVRLIGETTANRIKAEVLSARGRLLARLGEVAGAQADLEAALGIADKGGLVVEQVAAREGLASVAVKTDPMRAVELFEASAKIRGAQGYRQGASNARDHLRFELGELRDRSRLLGMPGPSVGEAWKRFQRFLTQ